MKADLHVHSKYSEHPSEWFLKRLGAGESYTEPEFVYRTAKERGMDYVTITDHNRIDGAMLLREKHPEDTFVSVEATTYFPDDGCKIHLLVYDINESQFSEIQRLRTNIFDLREYVRQENIAHSVAHATYSVNGKISITHLEKLILLFDVFEGINGSRMKLGNHAWQSVLSHLTPSDIERLVMKHRIEPASADAWVKGYTGGSDDHAGMLIGMTHTEGEGDSPKAFMRSIAEKRSIAGGRYNDYRTLAFTLYKIAYDFSRSTSTQSGKGMLSELTELVFNGKAISLLGNFKTRRLKSRAKKNNDTIQHLFAELVDAMKKHQSLSLDERFAAVYDRIASISDEFLKIILAGVEKQMKRGDLMKVVRNVSSSFVGIFLTLPFFATLKHMHKERSIVAALARAFPQTDAPKGKKILWFTDTLADLNGVSVTLKTIGWRAMIRHDALSLVTALGDDEMTKDIPPNTINLGYIHRFSLPYYEKLSLKIPSILRAIDTIARAEPDEIYISSPGPVGLIGLLAAKLLNVKAVNVYHTDFTAQSKHIIQQNSILDLSSLIEVFTKWFYERSDEITVPTSAYRDILIERGFTAEKMTIFRRGIDHTAFSPRRDGKEALSSYGIKDGRTIVYTGRVSKDKNLVFLTEAYRSVLATHPDTNLLIVGDGPDLKDLRSLMHDVPRAVFTGRLDNKALASIYSGAHLLVFPSTTDTFGMSVLEAQSCGLPAVVSDIGGPREIVTEGVTGSVLPVVRTEDWAMEIRSYLDLSERDPGEYNALRMRSRDRIVQRFNWDDVLNSIFGRTSEKRETVSV